MCHADMMWNQLPAISKSKVTCKLKILYHVIWVNNAAFSNRSIAISRLEAIIFLHDKGMFAINFSYCIYGIQCDYRIEFFQTSGNSWIEGNLKWIMLNR